MWWPVALPSQLLLIGLLACGRPQAPAAEQPAATPTAPPTESASPKTSAPAPDVAEALAALGDPAKRAAAIETLAQRYEDAVTIDKRDRSGPTTKALLDAIVAPLANVADDETLSPSARARALEVLADSRHPDATPLLARALSRYPFDDKRPDELHDAIGLIISSFAHTRAKEASAALLAVFAKFRASTVKAQRHQLYRRLHDSMSVVADPAWESALIAKLNVEVGSLKAKHQKELIDQVYWQTTAAKVLGLMRSATAIEPLMRVVMSPFKINVHTTAISALIKIAPAALGPCIALLQGKRAELARYAEQERLRAAVDRSEKVDARLKMLARTAYRRDATLMLANIGRREASAPLLELLKRGDGVVRANIAVELHKLPASAATLAAYKASWQQLSLSLQLESGEWAKERVTEAGAMWFDRGLARWLARESLALKGRGAEYVQHAALGVAVKQLGVKDWALVKTLAAVRYQGKPLAAAYQAELAQAESALARCQNAVGCWSNLLVDGNRAPKGQFAAIKAAHMIAAMGGSAVRSRLVAALPQVHDAVVLFTMAAAIDRLSPSGSSEAAAQMRKLIEGARRSFDPKRIHTYQPLTTVLDRLEARAR